MRAFSSQAIAIIEARLKQMSLTDPEVPVPNGRIARAQADCLFLKQDRVVYGADIDFESTNIGQRANQVAIERNRSFVFGNCFGVSSLSAKHMRHGKMGPGAARRGAYSLPRQPFCAVGIGVR